MEREIKNNIKKKKEEKLKEENLSSNDENHKLKKSRKSKVKNLADLKKDLEKVRDDLIKHYHKLLFEGKDTRNEGLSWIIRAIWKLSMF